jgi:hypothetical protein
MPEDDLILDPAGPEPEDEFFWDDTPATEYVNCALGVVGAFDAIDTQMLSKTGAAKVRQMRRWALKIAHAKLKEMYDQIFDDSDKTEEEE